MDHRVFINGVEITPFESNCLDFVCIHKEPVYPVLLNGVKHWVEDFVVDEGIIKSISLSTHKVICKNNKQWWSFGKINYSSYEGE